MVKIYLVETPNSSLPNESLTQVKGKTDGTQTICLGDVNNELCVEKTVEEAQIILNSWIDEENVNPEIDELGNPILQRYINISIIMEHI